MEDEMEDEPRKLASRRVQLVRIKAERSCRTCRRLRTDLFVVHSPALTQSHGLRQNTGLGGSRLATAV